MNKRQRRPRRADRADRDAAYRQALKLPADGPLPSQLGQADSAGSARGGRGASRKGEGRSS